APSHAADIFATWATPTTGTLNGVNFTVTGFTGFPSLFSANLSGANYSAAPGSASQQSVSYAVSNNWTISFASPISNLNLYGIFWRGTGASSGGGGVTTSYTFNQPITIASGMAGATAVGNLLTMPGNAFQNGILNFGAPVTTLSVTTNADSPSGQVLTLSTTVVSSAPEPGTLALLALGGVAVWVKRRRS
ncbi:PEP-CTERM sorting domain-containing protein, partial [Armatimonas sp.]|uniref:PEP-CTERM sorting domain-containing protein n=1 Tax=Armatimonas sp. TaxID=1872638 RepID=UPI00286CC768